MASSVGAHANVISLESALAVALTFRQAEVHALLCDEVLPACVDCAISFYGNAARFVGTGPAQDMCRNCRWPAEQVYSALGVTLHRYSDWLTPADRENAASLAASTERHAITGFTMGGITIGEHAMAATLRFFAVGSLDEEPGGEAVLRRYFEAALLTAFATSRLLNAIRFEALVSTHGIYVPWGIVSEVARRHGTRVVNWCSAYRKGRVLLSHQRTYHHELLSEPHDSWEHTPLTEAENNALTAYLATRRGGSKRNDSQEAPPCDVGEVLRRLGLDRSKKIIGALTNVVWDAQVHYPNRAFPSMLDWLVDTCEYFRGRPELQLLIRLHPSELTGAPATRQPVLPEMRRRYPDWPGNIFVIGPESNLSTYELMSACDAVTIYATVTGIELACTGLPVIVAGEAWVKNKGFTYDASTAAEYRRILDGLPFNRRLEKSQVARARQYAYHFFFSRLIPLACLEHESGRRTFHLKRDTWDELRPGHSKALDTICDGILKGTAFVFREAEVIG